MEKRVFLNELSLMIGTAFLIVAASTKNTYMILIGLVMISYSANKVKKLRDNTN